MSDEWQDRQRYLCEPMELIETLYALLVGLPLYILLGIYGFLGTLIFSVVFTVQVISAVLAPIAGAIYAWRSKGFGVSMSRRIKIGAACFACMVLPWLFLIRSDRNEAPPSPSMELPPRWVRIAWFVFVLSGPAPMIAGSFMNTGGETPLWLLVCTPLIVSAIIWTVWNRHLSRVQSGGAEMRTGDAETAPLQGNSQVLPFAYFSATIVAIPVSWILLSLAFN